MERKVRPEGDLRIVVKKGLKRPSLAETIISDLLRRIKIDEIRIWKVKNLVHLFRELRRYYLAKRLGLPFLYGKLSLVHIRDGKPINLGLASLRVVTSVGAEFLVDAIQNLVEPELLRYHALGTGTGAESAADIALGNEWTLSADYSGGSRATGTLEEGTATTVFRTVGTNTLASTADSAVTEFGLFTSAGTGGTLFDRAVFAPRTLSQNDSLQSTYDLTVNSGG